MADWQEDSNVYCHEHDANALCETCGKTWGNHIGRCCDDDESSPRRFKLAVPQPNVRDLIEQLCSAAVAYGESADGEQAYYAAKAKLIEATCGVMEDVSPTIAAPDARLQELAHEIKQLGLEVFDGPECPQMVRDAIEWFAAELSVSQLPRGVKGKTNGQ